MSESERRTLPCPRCAHCSVIAEAPCLVEVGPGFAGMVYGRPEVLPLPDSAFATCNRHGCGWSGTVRDVREAAAQLVARALLR